MNTYTHPSQTEYKLDDAYNLRRATPFERGTILYFIRDMVMLEYSHISWDGLEPYFTFRAIGSRHTSQTFCNFRVNAFDDILKKGDLIIPDTHMQTDYRRWAKVWWN